MCGPSFRAFVLFGTFAIPLVSCSDPSPIAPTGNSSVQLLSGPFEGALNQVGGRPIKGDCTTTFTFIDPSTVERCSVIQPVPSAFIAINGECTVSHLGRTELAAVQQLVFLLDGSGQPVLIEGQPVVSELRNCSTLTAANGDALVHTTIGKVVPAGPSQVAFSGPITFVGGTGRFASASGQAMFSGTASLATSTGAFSFEGTVSY